MNWSEIYAHVVASTGWTWDYVSEHVDLPRLNAMNEYWAQFPPVHIMVAGYMGYKPKEKPEENNFDELFRNFPPPA
jgi:hypothetical protein